MRAFFAVLLFLVLGFAGLMVVGSLLPSSGTSPSAPHSQTGCSASRRAIEARLKAPSSAKWIDCNAVTSGGVQTVTLTLDAQNPLGVMIRSQWVTTVRDNSVESVTQIR